jgi:hypothetical protein
VQTSYNLPINYPVDIDSRHNTYVDPHVDQVYFKRGYAMYEGHYDPDLHCPVPFYMLCGQILHTNVEAQLQHIAMDVTFKSKYPYNIRRAHLKKWPSLKTITIVMHVGQGKCIWLRGQPGMFREAPADDIQLVKDIQCPNGRTRFGYFPNVAKYVEETLKDCGRKYVPSVELAVLKKTVHDHHTSGPKTAFCCYSV